ncbi:hypothetical protein Pmani_010618 [Petrolisthes manimaculis]|uniref:Uncharacterized protein n=1 Tax=Petrolisthes manimaculis TaxID=1843537 RepID=A0AAE1UFC8_9EUCA|nr:hypothetical protein Pmani_010618 [Petrolisthes manimaculis]
MSSRIHTNPNESFHSRVWLYSPKRIPTTKNQMDFAVAQAMCDYNAGYLHSNFYVRMGLPFSIILEKYLCKKDKVSETPLKKKMRNKRLQKELDYTPG